MKFSASVVPGTVTHDSIVALFQYSSEMDIWLGEINPSFTPADPKGRCYEDEWAECLLQGGYLEINCSEPNEDEECEYSKTVKFTLKDMEKGLQILSKNYPHVFKEIVEDKCDFYTYWNWLQCSIYGDIIYG